MAEKYPLSEIGTKLNVSGFYSNGLKHFIGKTVTAIHRIPHSEPWVGDIAFEFEGGFLVAEPEGDCCSISWVEHVSGTQEIIGKEVVSVEERPELTSHQQADESKYDVLALYGISFFTADGHRIDIDYRNDSNGYYGGWLNWRWQETLNKDWEQVSEDW